GDRFKTAQLHEGDFGIGVQVHRQYIRNYIGKYIGLTNAKDKNTSLDVYGLGRENPLKQNPEAHRKPASNFFCGPPE
ncbi:MAG: hypothetical protein O9327_11020, partial [Polaromonas sp.]|nr:hypothetical protein [Polaromonas sp.]